VTKGTSVQEYSCLKNRWGHWYGVKGAIQWVQVSQHKEDKTITVITQVEQRL